jgi:hypothetical protein
MLRSVEGIFTAPLRGATSIEQLSVGCHPRLIYNAAAAAKTDSAPRPGATDPLLYLLRFHR